MTRVRRRNSQRNCGVLEGRELLSGYSIVNASSGAGCRWRRHFPDAGRHRPARGGDHRRAMTPSGRVVPCHSEMKQAGRGGRRSQAEADGGPVGPGDDQSGSSSPQQLVSRALNFSSVDRAESLITPGGWNGGRLRRRAPMVRAIDRVRTTPLKLAVCPISLSFVDVLNVPFL